MSTTTSLFRRADGTAFAAGATIFREGDPARCLYVIQEGEVELRDGDRVLEVVGQGGIFGEVAMIERTTRSADAVAKTDCTLVEIPESRFDYMIGQTPQFARVLMTVLCERLRHSTRAAT